MTTTKQIFTGDASQLANCYKDLAQQVTKLEDNLHRATAGGVAGHDKLASSIRAGTREILGMAQSYMGLAAVLASLNQRWDETLERGRNALEIQKGLAKEQARFIQNFAGTDEQLRQHLDTGLQIAKETGFPDLAAIQAAMTSAVSAAAGDTGLAIEAVREAARANRLTPEQLLPFTGATVDLATSTGVSAKEAIALLESAQVMGRVEQPGLNAKNLAQAMGKSVASQTGDRKVAGEAAAEMFSWLTFSVKDTEGARSAHAMSNLSSALNETFTQGIQIDGPGGQKLHLKPKGPDPGNARDRLRALMNDPAMAKSFAKKYTFEAGYEEVVESALLNPASEDRKRFEQFVGSVGYDVEAHERRILQLQNASPQIVAANAEAKQLAADQAKAAANARDAQTATATDLVKRKYAETREYSTVPWLIAPLVEGLALKGQGLVDYMTGHDPNKRAVENLKLRQEEILVRDRTLLGSEAYFSKRRTPEELSPQERAAYDDLGTAIGIRQSMIGQPAGGAHAELIGQLTKESDAAGAHAEQSLSIQELQLLELRKTNAILEENRHHATPSVGPAANAEPGIHSERGSRSTWGGRF